MNDEIARSSCKVKFRTVKGSSLEFTATNNEFNKHLGKHSPLIQAIRHLSFVCALTSEDIGKEAQEAFNEGIEKAKQRLAELESKQL